MLARLISSSSLGMPGQVLGYIALCLLAPMKTTIIFEKPGSEGEHVLVKLEMSSYYKEFINAIPDDTKIRDTRFKNGVSCVVWGAFYLESVINDTVVKILEDSTRDPIRNADMVWPLIEKVKTEQKFEFILDALMIDAGKKARFAKHVSALFRLRNRLAHYKEPSKEVAPLQVRQKHAAEIVHAQVVAARKTTPHIVDAVLSASVKDRRAVILEVGSWLECAIFDYYKPKELLHA